MNRDVLLDAARNAIRTKQSWVAVSKLKELLSAEPDCVDAYELLGIAHLIAKDIDSARQAFAHSVEIAPKRASCHLNYANFLFQVNEIDDAEEEIQAARYLAPNHPGIQALHAKIAKRIHDRNLGAENGFTVACVNNAERQKPSLLDTLQCPYCRGMNSVISRVCRHCNMRLPDEKPVIAVE